MLRAFFHKLPQHLLLPFRGHFLIGHLIAITLTALLVFSGFDWWYFLSTRSDSLHNLVRIAGLGGLLVPILLPIILYTHGKKRKNAFSIRVAIAVAQATIISWIIVAVYKTFTGRTQPGFGSMGNTVDTSHNFQFGFFEHGIFWGWPSHHTVVAVAAATVLYLAFKRPSARFGAFIWAAIVAAGASVGFHWFSDVVAGVVVGVVVGIAVWRDVR